MQRHAFTLALLLALGPTTAFAKRAFTLPDLYRLKTVASPVISPDGKWIVDGSRNPS